MHDESREEIPEIVSAGKDSVLVDVEDGVAGETGAGGDVVPAEEWHQDRCAAESGAGSVHSHVGIDGAWAPQ